MAFSFLRSVSVLLVSLRAVSADLNCTSSTSPTGVCGTAGNPSAITEFYQEAIYEAHFLQPEACATACANVPSCQSFSIYTGDPGAPPFCQLYDGNSTAVGFEADPSSNEYEYDLSCFTCSTSHPSCVTVPPGCSESPVSDPSFEYDDGSWSFNGGGIVAGTSSNPARTGTKIAQFSFSGEPFDTPEGSFQQTLSLCNGAAYTLSGHYSSPSHSSGIECDLEMSLGGALIHTQPLKDNRKYHPFLFPEPYVATGQSDVLEIDILCEYDSDGEGDAVINFDDITMEIANRPGSSSCSTISTKRSSSTKKSSSTKSSTSTKHSSSTKQSSTKSSISTKHSTSMGTPHRN